MSDSPSRIGELLLPGRRQFLRDAGLGFGGLALASLLGEESIANASAASARTLPHHAPKAKRVIWMNRTPRSRSRRAVRHWRANTWHFGSPVP